MMLYKVRLPCLPATHVRVGRRTRAVSPSDGETRPLAIYWRELFSQVRPVMSAPVTLAGLLFCWGSGGYPPEKCSSARGRFTGARG